MKSKKSAQFIRPMHPKTEIRPDHSAINRILKMGWIGQTKIHGHRAQIHINHDSTVDSVVFNRQGNTHRKKLPLHLDQELRRLLPIKSGWTAIDCEWVKSTDHLYLFDVIKLNDQLLRDFTYEDRYEILPQVYSSADIETLPLLRTVEKCFEVLETPGDRVEGLVFKAMATKGFPDTAIVRCRISSRH